MLSFKSISIRISILDQCSCISFSVQFSCKNNLWMALKSSGYMFNLPVFKTKLHLKSRAMLHSSSFDSSCLFRFFFLPFSSKSCASGNISYSLTSSCSIISRSSSGVKFFKSSMILFVSSVDIASPSSIYSCVTDLFRTTIMICRLRERSCR